GVRAARGRRLVAAGDRVRVRQHGRGLGGTTATLGAVVERSERSLCVRSDDGRNVSFDLKDYNHIDHGYAATIHKAQGMTVDGAHVLAAPGMDAHSSYVALSRHRVRLDLHYGRDAFATRDRLVGALSRDRAKDMASDYPAQDYAERRGINFSERNAEIARKVAPERKVEADPEAALRSARTRALVRHARAVDAIFEMQEQGGKGGPEQVKELQEARKA